LVCCTKKNLATLLTAFFFRQQGFDAATTELVFACGRMVHLKKMNGQFLATYVHVLHPRMFELFMPWGRCYDH
jgi:hypothetical protein